MLERVKPLLASAALILAVSCFAACSSPGSNAGAKQNSSDVAAGLPDGAALDAGNETVSPLPRSAGPAIVIMWEALAREKYLQENSRFRRRGVQPPQKITLISRSHPDASGITTWLTKRGFEGTEDGQLRRRVQPSDG